MRRVLLPPSLPRTVALAGLHEHGLPETIRLVDLGSTRELFVDFSALEEAAGPARVPDLDEPVLTIDHLRSWMRVAGLKAPGLPLVLGTESGSIWLLSDEAPFLLNRSCPALEACLTRRGEFFELMKSDLPGARDAFPHLVDFIVQHEPGVGHARSSALRWSWHGHLEGIADDLELTAFPFPWRHD